MKKVLLFVAAVAASASMNAQTAQVRPVAIDSGFNQDVIAESTTLDGNGYLTSVTQDYQEEGNSEWSGIDGGGMVYYTSDAIAEGALCGSDGLFSTDNGNIQYYVNPIGFNALVLKNKNVATPVNSGTLVFSKAQVGKSIYIAGTSTDGNTDIKVTANYQDGTTSHQNITFYNWDSSAYKSSAVVTGMGRMISEAGNWSGQAAGTTQGGLNFMVFQSSIDTEVKPIVSVTVEKVDPTATSCVAIFAVSMSNQGVDDTSVESASTAATVSGYYTLGGAQIAQPVKGINIVKYSDGTTKKVVRR